ncbi:ribosome maturation factor RimM [Bacteroidota bacterium]
MNLRVLGTISRSHGLNGGFKLNHTAGVCPELEKEEPVFIHLQGGPVPFFIEEFTKSSPSNIIIKLESLNSVEQIQRFIGKELFLEADRFKSELFENDTESLTGFSVYDTQHGYVGDISEIMHLPQQSIMVVLNDTKEILIPLVDEIIADTDFEARKIMVDTPDGLIDLYTNG